MQFYTKLKTTSTGNNTFLFISHTKPKKCYSTSIQISGSIQTLKIAIRYIPSNDVVVLQMVRHWYHFVFCRSFCRHHRGVVWSGNSYLQSTLLCVSTWKFR